MPLLLGQLVYTSFPGVGFRTLASTQVPPEIQQAFIQQVVYQRWDSYNPPRSGYRAAYLHQVTLEDSLFGWLYNDGQDDFGRSQVPYFVCYYYSGRLHAVQLENIFNCLDRGPVALIDQQLPDTLETIVFPDLVGYQPSRIGVVIPSDVRDRSYVAIGQRRLLDLFVPVDGEIVIELNEQIYKQQSALNPSVTAAPMPQASPFGQDTTPILREKQAELQVGSHPSDASVPTSPKKSAWLIGIATGVTLALMFGSYYLRQTVSTAKQQYPVSIPSPNTSLGNIALVSTLTGHSDSVWSVALSPDGQTLASGSADKTIKVWNLDTGKPLHTLTGHSEAVWSVAIRPDGQIASSSSDNTIKLWNLSSGKLLHTLTGHSEAVWSVAVSPNGQIASGSSDNTIKLWLSSGELLRSLAGHPQAVRSVAFSSNGQIVSGSSDNTIKLWNLSSGKLLRTFLGHTNRVISLALSSNGQILASGSVDKTVKIWHLSSGKLLHSFSRNSHWSNAVAISPDGRTVASGIGDIIKIWDLSTGELLHTLSGHSSDITSICFSANGKQLVSGSRDQTIKIWQ